jgi:hypothetical protein
MISPEHSEKACTHHIYFLKRLVKLSINAFSGYYSNIRRMIHLHLFA